ncbi:FtsX-like permease family protein [Glaciecola petra]|uniref:FtsX-like permease family protein n=1 Tax=Glaciecola petra TaxID=3075602 RepID=A0ABU2ZUJ8_9ALTE|nr:FtsX-like permease family protein [Aestuariibacter sp. P117]MDT0596310.1 FtsX-like permease family protein [Aestuariibacter sp. P117]
MSLTLDIKYAARLLSKKPSFTALTVAIVAVGLGLTLYTFSLLNSLLFSPLSFADNKPIFAVEGFYDHTHLSRRPLMAFDAYNLQQNNAIFEEMGFYQEGTTFVGGPDEGLRKFNSSYVTANMFTFTDIQPILGRVLQEEDHFEGAEAVLVLGFDMWQNYFNGDPNIIDQIVPIDGADPARVVGVMPEGFGFPAIAQMWQPLSQDVVAPTQRNYGWVYGFAKLKDGVSLSQAEVSLNEKSREIAASLTDDFNWLIPDNNLYFSIEPIKKANITQYYGMFIALFIVVFLILLLACINVGNLLLARVNERIKEVAIRVALGVPRKRLVLQMLWESIFICLLGGFLAILLAGWGLDITNHVFDSAYEVDNLKPFWWVVALDSDALVALAIAIIAMVLITGFIPAWKSLNGDFNSVLRDGTRGALGKKAANVSRVLVISEILLSCVVLVMATILLVSSYSAGNADYGVNTSKRLTAQIQLSPSDFPVRWDTEFEFEDRQIRTKFYYDLKTELENNQNVEAAIYMSQLPGTGGGTSYFEIEGQKAEVLNENPYSNNEAVSSGSWHALDMQIVQGRDFDYRDVGLEVDSIIINESIARDFFPDGDAIGQRVRRAREEDYEGGWSTIVGVVSDSFHGTTMDFSSASYNSYHPMDNWGPFSIMMAMHYRGTQAEAQQILFDTVNKVNPNVGVFHVQSYDALIKKPMILISAVSKIFLLCGVVAAFLAASGIYAVAANSVQQRTQEIGVRRALGSSDGKILSLFMTQASWQLLLGIACGVGISIWLLSLMAQTMIFSQSSYLIAMLGMPSLIICMVLLATYIPTRRVVQMEPSDALHYN